MRVQILRTLLTLMVTVAAWGQGTSAPREIRRVTANPSGACTASVPLRLNTTTGALWACKAGTWANIAGGSGGGGAAGSTGQLQYNNAGALGGANGANTPYTIGPIPGVGLTSDSTTVLRITKFDDTSVLQIRASGESNAQLLLVADGGTLDVPTGLVSGDTVGRIVTLGYSTTAAAFKSGGTLQFIVDGTPDANGVPVKMLFQAYSLATSGTVVPLVVYSSGKVELLGVAFASLGTPVDGTIAYCNNCTVVSGVDNTCAGSGTGADAKRLNGVWKCFQ
jgi:hypothetical protein